MAIYIGTKEEIDEYFLTESVNQSTLKELQGGLNSLMASIAKKEKDKKENKAVPEYFILGGGVDCELTGEEGEFRKQYYVSQLDKIPSEVEMQIIESVFNEMAGAGVIEDIEFTDCDDAILAAANEFEWQMRWKPETRVEKLKIAGSVYFDELKGAIGKQIISSEMNHRIGTIVQSLRTHRRTKKYFDRELQAQQEFIDFYYQFPIYFTLEGIECKALMDLVVVHKDTNGNIVKIEPIDLKTMAGDPLHFLSNMKKHRYDIQSAWYIKALSIYFGCEEDVIDPFKFIVESTTNVGNPLVFRITEDTLNHGRNGAPEATITDAVTGRQIFYPEVKGYKQLLTDYIYYLERDFKEDKILEMNDIIELDWLKGIQNGK